MFKLNLEKAEEPEIKLPTSAGSLEKQDSSRKTSTSASLNTWTPLTVWMTTNWKILQEKGIPDHLTCLLEIFIQVKKQQLELEMEQWTGSKLEKEYVKAVYCHPAYLTYMHSTSCEIPGLLKHMLESRLPEEISIPLDIEMTLPLWQKAKKN